MILALRQANREIVRVKWITNNASGVQETDEVPIQLPLAAGLEDEVEDEVDGVPRLHVIPRYDRPCASSMSR